MQQNITQSPSLILFSVLLIVSACNQAAEESTEDSAKFDSEKWLFEENGHYPYREELLNSILYTDTIRSLNRDQVLEYLGEPDRIENDHMYYTVDESKLGMWTLHASSLVIRINEKDSVESIKLHE